MTGGCDPGLIYDVGMHTGEDTAYYLHCGFRVVAIEANPALVQAARKKFRAQLAGAQLQIVAAGIAPEGGEAEFYISTSKSVWSSFDKANATKAGGKATAVRVRCLRFDEVLRQYGIPYYLKVDIEGHDRLCIEALEPPALPRYVSIEMDHRDGGRDIQHLATLGYGSFKLVRQNDLQVLATDQLPIYLARRQRIANAGPVGHLFRHASNLRNRFRRPRLDGWTFPKGASGPFGKELDGRWLDASTALALWQALRDADEQLGGSGFGDWFDIHAAR